MQETRVRSQGREDTLEKRMATHSSILAWRIPPTGEAGGLQSMGSQRLEHNWVTHTHTHTHTHTIPLKNIPEELPLTLILEHVQWKIIHSFSSPDNVFISSSLLKGYFSMNIQFFQHLKKKEKKKRTIVRVLHCFWGELCGHLNYRVLFTSGCFQDCFVPAGSLHVL